MAGQVTVIWSPVEGLGRTTLGAHLADRLAEKGFVTLLVDLNRYASALPYVFQSFNDKSLRQACNSLNASEIFKNCSEVKGRDGLFLLNLSFGDKVDTLYRFPSERVEWMLKCCREQVDRLLILMPSNYIETGFVSALAMEPESMIIVMDEDLASWHRLKLYDNYFEELGVHIPRTLTVINKTIGMLSEESFKQFDIRMMGRSLQLPYLEAVRRNRNEGCLVRTVPMQNRAEKAFCKGVKTIVSFVCEVEDRRTVG